MRPTIDEQLAGAQRLLDLVAADDGLSAGSAQLLRNAGRLLTRVGASWSAAGPFLADDNARTAALLGLPAREETAGLPATAAHNEELRAELAAAIRTLPDTPDGRARRAEIGAHLRRRLAADPT